MLVPNFRLCAPRFQLRLSTNWNVSMDRRFPTVKSSGIVIGPVKVGCAGFALGFTKLNVKWFWPTTSSLTMVPPGFQRQLPAQLYGARSVLTRHGNPGKAGSPPLTESQFVFW